MVDMIRRFILLAFLSSTKLLAIGQENLAVIKASSRYVDIRDGLHFRKKYWHILPEKRPDQYFVEIPHKTHIVSFITDIDSISFKIEYGKEYDFIILLNNKDSCYTRIVAREKKVLPAAQSMFPAKNDTLPFRIGNNSKIYLKGSINNSTPIDIQFDLGLSGQCVIKKSSVQKVNMILDGKIVLSNSDGINEVPSSSSNMLMVGGLRWDSIPFTVANNMTRREDMILGNALFQNKVLEINYDNKFIVVHDTMPPVGPEYTRHEMILDVNVVPFVKGSLKFRSKTKDGWFLFDTGAYTTILNDEDIPPANKISTEARKIVGLSTQSQIPEITVNGYRFANFSYTTQKINPSEMAGILGNDLLKRFNVIIDNRNGYIYFQPNSLMNASYANPEYYLVRVIAAFILLIILIVFFVIYRRRRRKRMR